MAIVLYLILDVPPTINHAYINTRSGGKKLNSNALKYIEKAREITQREMEKQGWTMTEKEKVVLDIYTYFPDNRVRDCHNGGKVLFDTLEGLVYDNDRYILPRYIDTKVDKNNPRIELKIYKLKENKKNGKTKGQDC